MFPSEFGRRAPIEFEHVVEPLGMDHSALCVRDVDNPPAFQEAAGLCMGQNRACKQEPGALAVFCRMDHKRRHCVIVHEKAPLGRAGRLTLRESIASSPSGWMPLRWTMTRRLPAADNHA